MTTVGWFARFEEELIQHWYWHQCSLAGYDHRYNERIKLHRWYNQIESGAFKINTRICTYIRKGQRPQKPAAYESPECLQDTLNWKEFFNKKLFEYIQTNYSSIPIHLISYMISFVQTGYDRLKQQEEEEMSIWTHSLVI